MDINECDCMTTGTAQRMRARLSSLGPAKAGNELQRGLNYCVLGWALGEAARAKWIKSAEDVRHGPILY